MISCGIVLQSDILHDSIIVCESQASLKRSLYCIQLMVASVASNIAAAVAVAAAFDDSVIAVSIVIALSAVDPQTALYVAAVVHVVLVVIVLAVSVALVAIVTVAPAVPAFAFHDSGSQPNSMMAIRQID